LKEPSPAAQTHSKLLCEKIAALIQSQDGKITFAEYMQQALYAPGLGYYNAGTTKFGANGDFVTAPELGSLFAQCVATQCTEIINKLNCESTILEIGAGSGQLACDLLKFLDKLKVKISKYLILEISADLRHTQKQKILTQCPEFINQVEWLNQLPAPPITGVIIANEVMDAMPVNIFNFNNNKLQEYYVTHADSGFTYQLGPATAQLQRDFSASNISLHLELNTDPYVSEINLFLSGWIRSLSNSLKTGAILLFDYGFTRAEYYHPQRSNGTLMCHYQHHAHSDTFWYPGLQDITAHVDFTAVAEAADTNDLQVSGFTNLASFLINCGISNFLEKSIKQAHELNILTSPAEMGELFKAIILTKTLDEDLLGFTQFSKLHNL
jgi:SAM-dependent MidA family methyltransferase